MEESMNSPALAVSIPRHGEVRVRVGAVGLSSLGLQAAGHIEAVGPEAAGFARGDRVAYRTNFPRTGLRPVVSERDLIGFPKDVSIDQAAALLPLGLLSRTIVKQLHTIGKGNRVVVEKDAAGVHSFVSAWVIDLGGIIVDSAERNSADVVISEADFTVARLWRNSHGFAQQAAADVFEAVRRGVFAGLAITSYPLVQAEQARRDLQDSKVAGPIVLLPMAA
jgi:NADPH:quinone reductase-like Zn-dependent oxidoreductase